MIENYKVIYEGGSAQITEKKSKFIATVAPINSEDKAEDFINQLKKKYWDAAHNCFAYTIGINHEIQRCSDDGEPSNTAGKPILDVILGEKIHDVAVVVTRYFGGTLLGVGGLVRAYSKSVQAGLAESIIVEKHLAERLYLAIDYNGIGKIQYIVNQMEIVTLNTEYTENVTLEILVQINQKDKFEKKVTEITGGKIQIKKLSTVYYADILGKIEVFQI